MPQIVNSPIDVNINFSQKEMKVGLGDTINVPITIKNHKSDEIKVDIWIKTLDDNSQQLLEWCEFQDKDNKPLAFPLKLAKQSSRNINLKFQVPLDNKLIKTYKYEISVEDDYSKIPFCRPQKLIVIKIPNLENQWRTKT